MEYRKISLLVPGVGLPFNKIHYFIKLLDTRIQIYLHLKKAGSFGT